MFDRVRQPAELPQKTKQEVPTPHIDYWRELKKAKKADQKAERAYKNWERLPLKIAAFAILTSSLVQVYMSDVRANQELASLSVPEIEPISDPDGAPQDSAIYYLGGFDTVSGYAFGEKVGPAINEIFNYKNMSIKYGTASTDPEELGEQVIEHADTHDITNIVLAGNSAHGITSVEVADYILNHSNLRVAAIFTSNSPEGYDSLRPESQTNLTNIIRVLRIPYAKDSTYMRFVATMAQGINRYTQGTLPENIDAFFTVADETWQDIQQRRRSGMWVIAEQAIDIVNADLKSTLSAIGSHRDKKQMPIIITMRPTNPNDDTVVDVEKSSKDICTYSTEAGLACSVVLVDGAYHTSSSFNTESFMNALAHSKEVINNEVRLEQSYYAVNHYELSRLIVGRR